MAQQIKVVLLGESSVGKTCIVKRFANDSFNEDSNATLGATFVSKTLDMPEYGVAIKFQIWDTAGQEKYRSLAEMYYKDAVAAILVYDITKKASFDGITYWLEELKKNAPEGIKIAVAANKSDLVEKEEIPMSAAQKYATENNASFHSTSAKEGTGIKELFITIAKNLGRLPSSPAATDGSVFFVLIVNFRQSRLSRK